MSHEIVWVLGIFTAVIGACLSYIIWSLKKFQETLTIDSNIRTSANKNSIDKTGCQLMDLIKTQRDSLYDTDGSQIYVSDEECRRRMSMCLIKCDVGMSSSELNKQLSAHALEILLANQVKKKGRPKK